MKGRLQLPSCKRHNVAVCQVQLTTITSSHPLHSVWQNLCQYAPPIYPSIASVVRRNGSSSHTSTKIGVFTYLLFKSINVLSYSNSQFDLSFLRISFLYIFKVLHLLNIFDFCLQPSFDTMCSKNFTDLSHTPPLLKLNNALTLKQFEYHL